MSQEGHHEEWHPLICKKAVIQWTQCVIFPLLANNKDQWRFRVQLRTIKVAANNSSHCTLATRPFPSQQRQAPERAGITVSQISNHIYKQLIKMLQNFSLVSCTTILTCGFYKVMTTCSVIFTFFLHQQQQHKRLLFSIQKLTNVECSGNVQVKFCVVFLCKQNFALLFCAKIKFCVFFCCTMRLLIFFVVQLMQQNIYEGFTYRNKIVL